MWVAKNPEGKYHLFNVKPIFNCWYCAWVEPNFHRQANDALTFQYLRTTAYKTVTPAQLGFEMNWRDEPIEITSLSDKNEVNDQKHMKESINKVIHHNYWYWGESYYIILDNGNGIVTMQIENDYKIIGHISGLSVTYSARNKGLGNELLNACEELAKSLNIKKLYLYAEKNSWVFEWYKRHGYIEDKSENKYLYKLSKLL